MSAHNLSVPWRFENVMANCFASVVREADTAADAGSAITLRIGAHLA